MFFLVEQFSENSLVLAEQAIVLHLWANGAIYCSLQINWAQKPRDWFQWLGQDLGPAFVPNKGPGFGLGTRPRYHLVQPYFCLVKPQQSHKYDNIIKRFVIQLIFSSVFNENIPNSNFSPSTFKINEISSKFRNIQSRNYNMK